MVIHAFVPPFTAVIIGMANIKLTPNIRQLLSPRKPGSFASPLPRLNQVFTKTFQDAQTKRAETGWLVAAVSVLS